LELQAAFAEALGIPLEGGRPVLSSMRHSKEAIEEHAPIVSELKAAAKDARRSVAKALRRRLEDLDVGTFEKVCTKMLHALGFRELKAAKRSKDGPLMTARRREGSVELRFAVRVLKGGSSVERRMVQELRRDLGHYSAHVGLLLSPGDCRGDARGEAQSSGPLVMLWCAEALAEKLLEAKTAVAVTHLELFTIDDHFFEVAHSEAEDSKRRREERHRRRQELTAAGLERPDEQVSLGGAPEGVAGERPAAPPEGEPGPEGMDEEAEGEEGGDDDVEAAFATGGGERAASLAPREGGRRRRRRRRGRRGRGPKPEGAAGQGHGAEAPLAAPPSAPSPQGSSSSGEGGAGPVQP
jgi:hypothetical protein